jgi:hypothetical protein
MNKFTLQQELKGEGQHFDRELRVEQVVKELEALVLVPILAYGRVITLRGSLTYEF